MGQKIEIDIDDLFKILSTLEDGGHPIPMMVFDMIGDCNLDDIDKYAIKVSLQDNFGEADYTAIKSDLEEILKGWLGKKAIAEMKGKREKKEKEQ